MRQITIDVMYGDYLDYQKYYQHELGWNMYETFPEYVQRCIDNGELDEYEPAEEEDDEE